MYLRSNEYLRTVKKESVNLDGKLTLPWRLFQD